MNMQLNCGDGSCREPAAKKMLNELEGITEEACRLADTVENRLADIYMAIPTASTGDNLPEKQAHEPLPAIFDKIRSLMAGIKRSHSRIDEVISRCEV